MTREEIINLLEILTENYGKKVSNPKVLTDNWEMILGHYSAEAVYKAARLHMSTSNYFPNPTQIKKNITKAKLVYDNPTQPVIEAESGKSLDQQLKEWEPYLDAFCEWIGFGCDPNDDINLKDFLPYER